MKTRITQIAAAAFFAFLLIAGNAQADGKDLSSASLEAITEPKMEVENWMINEIYWNRTDAAFLLDYVSESHLELENWMVDDTAWENVIVNSEENEKEAGLVVEPWMINDKVWDK
ncbi:hypothetical protein GM418_15230 [Maribellus comscasis]|uniref:Uncharacterized protein n=1 Tax=Maribellus comscasis TaxID=2681766 RepID=A0A6I6K4Q0_9BACT|nr:hypothetical protein [Maribellus comscasis]QGY44974.1 hypothetical protein GM418_15230 [Maribellus comscasis]